MSTIITRSAKGSPLEWAEVDANFTNLNTDKIQVVGTPANGQAVVWDSTNSRWIPATVAGGSGSVTSVSMSVPSLLSVAGSPITTSGTLAISYSDIPLPVVNGGFGNKDGSIDGGDY
jgi:hypothetical protein